jgi:hypothetical protein
MVNGAIALIPQIGQKSAKYHRDLVYLQWWTPLMMRRRT